MWRALRQAVLFTGTITQYWEGLCRQTIEFPTGVCVWAWPQPGASSAGSRSQTPAAPVSGSSPVGSTLEDPHCSPEDAVVQVVIRTEPCPICIPQLATFSCSWKLLVPTTIPYVSHGTLTSPPWRIEGLSADQKSGRCLGENSSSLETSEFPPQQVSQR